MSHQLEKTPEEWDSYHQEKKARMLNIAKNFDAIVNESGINREELNKKLGYPLEWKYLEKIEGDLDNPDPNLFENGLRELLSFMKEKVVFRNEHNVEVVTPCIPNDFNSEACNTAGFLADCYGRLGRECTLLAIKSLKRARWDELKTLSLSYLDSFCYSYGTIFDREDQLFSLWKCIILQNYTFEDLSWLSKMTVKMTRTFTEIVVDSADQNPQFDFVFALLKKFCEIVPKCEGHCYQYQNLDRVCSCKSIASLCCNLSKEWKKRVDQSLTKNDITILRPPKFIGYSKSQSGELSKKDLIEIYLNQEMLFQKKEQEIISKELDKIVRKYY